MCKEGEIGDKFYIIIEGSAAVYLKNEEKANTLTEFNQMHRLDRDDLIQELNDKRLPKADSL